MTNLRLKLFAAGACAVLMLTATCAAHPGSNAKLLRQIQETITKIQAMKGPPSMARTNEAEHLSELTEKVNSAEVNDRTLGNLISLLDNAPDDSVRLWVAAAIGNLGPRAKSAVPALLRDVRETDCIPLAEMTSAGAARVALKRIGVVPPPLPDCKGKWKSPAKRQKSGKE